MSSDLGEGEQHPLILIYAEHACLELLLNLVGISASLRSLKSSTLVLNYDI